MTSPTPSPRTDVLLRRGIGTILVLLVIQFVSGMLLNLYTALPPTHPGTGDTYTPSLPWALAGGGGIVLAIHVATWLGLTLVGVGLMVLGGLRRRTGYLVGTSIGLGCLLLAASGGLTFLNRGGDAAESLLMALGFLAALVTYALTAYGMRKR